MECFQDCRIRLFSVWILVIGSFNIAGLQPQSVVRAETVELKIPAVAGGEALLPCDTRLDPPDVLLLVVWYKDDVPIYSFDSRVKSPSAHWADEILGGRAKWQQEPMSGLRIRNVLPADRALYRCRVDFKSVPTRNQKIVLDVIELPDKPRIFDEHDKEIIGVAGPYVEDTSLKLTCVVSGGKPMPRVRWLRDDKVVAQLTPLEDGSSISMLELRIVKLSRQYLDAVYTCTADNTQQVQALRVNVQIQLYLRPLSVEIVETEQPLSVGQEAEIACRAVGARPPAVISWWIDGKKLYSVKEQRDSEDRNETVSILRWTPQRPHDGHQLTCRATHVKLETKIETSKTLKLHYVPIVTLKLGSSMNPNDIEEGDDVYFDCSVEAYPPAYKIVWEHNGQLLTQNQKGVMIPGSSNLVLQKASRELAGEYVCTASNVEGDGRSNPISLQIIYKPVCTNTHTAIVGAALNEATEVTCEVDAFPPPKNFQWTLNNSMGTVELETQGNFTIDPKARSVLIYTPTSEADYGSLACRAINLAGQQVEPCRYTLLPAVKPDPLVNCSTVNLTDDSAELRCVSGYDGGLHTMYTVEVWDSGNVLANVTKATPVWKLRGLGSGKQLKLLFYAHNARGRSESTTSRIHTLSRLALHTEAKTASNAQVDASWALGIIAAIVGALTVIIAVAVLARRRHHRPMQYEAPMQTVKAYKNSMHSANHSPIQPDDKNPDVVPLGKDYNCTRAVERPPEPPPYAVSTPPVGASRSAHSLQQDGRAGTPHTPNTPASDAQSIGTLAEDRRSVTSGTLSRRREVVTTRTPLLANARESCV